jgi:hypothetical protein
MSYFDGIDDDIDFCTKLAKEESVVICPGKTEHRCSCIAAGFQNKIHTLMEILPFKKIQRDGNIYFLRKCILLVDKLLAFFNKTVWC